MVWTENEEYLISGSGDRKIKIWNAHTWKIEKTIKGRYGDINSIALSPCKKLIAGGCEDRCVHVWSFETGREEVVLEGHTSYVRDVTFSPDGKLLASKSPDCRLTVWRCDTWTPVLYQSEKCSTNCGGVSFHPSLPLLASRNDDTQHHDINIFKLNYDFIFNKSIDEDMVHYTTARIALVGDSGVGKTGLGWRLSQGVFKEHSSTHGQQFWIVDELCTRREDGTECEAVIWDFAGQPDYRLVHSLFLDDIDLALILFDPVNREKPLSGVEFWLNQLSLINNSERSAILVGARIDRGVVPIAESELTHFCEKHNIGGGYVPTSAKTGEGLSRLLEIVKAQILWKDMTSTVTTKTFKTIKEFILQLKEQINTEPDANNEILVTPKRLKSLIENKYEMLKFSDDEMMTAVKHLENHGYISVLKRITGEVIILLTPDLIVNLASSLVLEARRNARGLGSLEEEVLLKNGYEFNELKNLCDSDKNIVIDAVVHLFICHNICFREAYNDVTYLVFPSLINERRPSIREYNTIDDVSYKIIGPVENIYASLVVLLGYTNIFTRLNQWQNQALFTIEGDNLCGFRQILERENELEIILFYGENSPEHLKLLFQGMVERLLNMRDVVISRYQPLKCNKCMEVQDRSSVMKQIERQKANMHCIECGNKLAIPTTEVIAKFRPREKAKVEFGQATAKRRTEFESALVWVKGFLRDRGEGVKPTCFLSYAWGNSENEKWVFNLALALRNADIDVIFDKWHNPPGSSITKFIEKIDSADYIVAVGTPEYLKKYNDEGADPVVDAEIRLISTKLRKREEVRKTVIPLLLSSTQKESFPPLFEDSVYINMKDNDYYFNNLFDLILTLFSIPFDHPRVIEYRNMYAIVTNPDDN